MIWGEYCWALLCDLGCDLVECDLECDSQEDGGAGAVWDCGPRERSRLLRSKMAAAGSRLWSQLSRLQLLAETSLTIILDHFIR
jgi:hypothetical protein